MAGPGADGLHASEARIRLRVQWHRQVVCRRSRTEPRAVHDPGGRTVLARARHPGHPPGRARAAVRDRVQEKEAMTDETGDDIGFEAERDGEREAGIYVSEFLGVFPFQYDDKVTGEKQDRWRWVFRDDKQRELDTLTSPHFRPRSNGLKLLTGILGRAPKSGDKPNDKVGTIVNAVWGENQGGKLTIVNVLPYKPAKRPG